jgi:type II secretory pathway component PulC
MMKFTDVSRWVLDLRTAGNALQGIATFLAAGYLSYVLFMVFAGSSGTEGVEELPVASPVNSEASADNPKPDLLQIADWHLFGQAVSHDQANGGVAESRLQLKLLGVFLLSQAPENAYAIIQAEDGQQKKYRPGDELPGGATLRSIEHLRILLSHDNRQEFLALQRNSAGSSATTENPPL